MLQSMLACQSAHYGNYYSIPSSGTINGNSALTTIEISADKALELFEVNGLIY